MDYDFNKYNMSDMSPECVDDEELDDDLDFEEIPEVGPNPIEEEYNNRLYREQRKIATENGVDFDSLQSLAEGDGEESQLAKNVLGSIMDHAINCVFR